MKRELNHSIFVIDAKISASVGMDEAVALLFWPAGPCRVILPFVPYCWSFWTIWKQNQKPKMKFWAFPVKLVAIDWNCLPHYGERLIGSPVFHYILLLSGPKYTKTSRTCLFITLNQLNCLSTKTECICLLKAKLTVLVSKNQPLKTSAGPPV